MTGEASHRALAEKAVASGLDALDAAWARASERREEGLRFGPLGLRLRIGGGRLAGALLPAVSHARGGPVPRDHPLLTAVDLAADGAALPHGRWPLPVRSRDDLAHQYHEAAADLSLLADLGRGLWRYGSGGEGRYGFAVRDGAALPDWDEGAPFRHEIDWIARRHGLQLAHTAAIGLGGFGILLTGPGGSGKSTTTAAAALSGWQVAGEDFTLLEPGAPPLAHMVYDTMKLGPFGLSLDPALESAVVNPARSGEEKARLHLSTLRPDAMAGSLRIGALVVARVSGEARSILTPIGRAEAMRALAPSTIFLLKVGREAVFRRLGALVSGLPCYRIDLGRDPLEAVRALEPLCQRVAA